MSVNQQTIAEKLDLSVSTVSRALRNDRAIPATTRARVIRAASDLGYRRRPDGGSTSQRSAQAPSKTVIGVFAPVVGGLNWSAAGTHEAGHFMLTGISAATAARGVYMLFHGVRNDDLANLLLPDNPDSALRNESLAGAVLLYSHPHPVAERLFELMPCVTIVDRYSGLKMDCVGEDADSGIDAMVQHLCDLGHKRIGFVHGDSLGEWVVDRFACYVKSLTRRGIPVDPSIVLGVYGERVAIKQRADWLLDQTKRGATAWMCSNDLTGYEVCRALKAKGLSIPGDVSVTGFDGVEPVGGMPPLTTVSAPLVELGEEAVDRLLFRIANPTDSIRNIQLACRMTVGQTTAEVRVPA